MIFITVLSAVFTTDAERHLPVKTPISPTKPYSSMNKVNRILLENLELKEDFETSERLYADDLKRK